MDTNQKICEKGLKGKWLSLTFDFKFKPANGFFLKQKSCAGVKFSGKTI